MRLGRMLMLAAVLLIVGGGAIFAVFYFTGGLGPSTEEVTEIPKTSVVMISQPVFRGDILSEDNLFVSEIPTADFPEFMQAAMFTDISEIDGWVARFDMDQATIVTNNMIFEDPGMLGNSGGSDHAILIPRGKVAFPIPISRFSSVGFGLSQGDRVNVIANMMFVDLDQQFQTILPNNSANILPPGQGFLMGIESYLDGDSTTAAQFLTGLGTGFDDLELGIENTVAQIISSGSVGQVGRAELDAVLNLPFYVVPSERVQRPRLVSQTVLEGALVLQMGTFPEYVQDEIAPVVEDPNAPPPDPNAAPTAIPIIPLKLPDIVTLIVSPQEAVTLNYLIYAGADLTMALRSGLSDDPNISTSAVTLEFLMNTYNIPIPNRLSYGLEPSMEELVAPELPNDIPTPTPVPQQ